MGFISLRISLQILEFVLIFFLFLITVCSPLKGYSVLTRFNLICLGWVDNDNSILSYQFFSETNGNLKSELSYSDQNNFAILNAKFSDQSFLTDFLLGEGDVDKNYTVKILIKVFGIYNTYTEVNLVVQV